MGGKSQQTTDAPYGWVIVAIAFLLQIAAFGALVNISVFLKPLATEFGWHRGELSFSYTAISIGAGIGGLVMGTLSDRLPARRMVLFGILSLSILLFALSTIQALWQVYLISVLIGLLGFASINVPMLNLLGKWFQNNLGLAIGITTSGSAVGQGVMPLLATHLIEAFGWRDAYSILGTGYLLALTPLILLIKPPAEATATTPGQAAKAPVVFGVSRETLVWLLALAVVFCCITMATPIVHLVSLASDNGISPTSAATVMTFMMIAGVGGRLLAGRLADKFGGIQAYAITALAQTVLVFWFTQLHSFTAFLAFAIVFGLGYAGVMTSLLYCARQFAPEGKSGRSLGIVMIFGWSGMGIGGWQAGYLFDLTGEYVWSFSTATLSGVINLAIIALMYYLANRRPSPPPAMAV